MKDLIERNIRWENLGGHAKSAYRFSVERAVVSKETAVLSVELKLNFTLPPSDRTRVERALAGSVRGLAGARLLLDYEEPLLSPAVTQDAGGAKKDAAGAKKGAGGAKKSAGGQSGARAESAGAKKGAGGELLFGRSLPAAALTPLTGLDEQSGNVTVEGVIFASEAREVFDMNAKKMRVTLKITDYEDSACVKAVMEAKAWSKTESRLTKGTRIRVSGTAVFDHYDNEPVIRARSAEKRPPVTRRDDSPKKRVELHAHTKMSALDGLADVTELVELAAAFGHEAVAITDHGVVQAFPDAAKAAKKSGIKIIFGLEGYLFDDGSFRGEPGENFSDCADRRHYRTGRTDHIILLARNREGLKNLYKIVSYSHLNYFYKKPRIPKSLLAEYREGILVGSACEAGQLYRAMRSGLAPEEIERVASFYDYFEIQPLINNRFLVDGGLVESTEALKRLNAEIVALGNRLGKPVAATCDAHYAEKYGAKYRAIIMAGQGYKDTEGEQGLFFRTTEEMLAEFDYLGEETARAVVIEAPARIAAQVEVMQPVPAGKFPPRIENADAILRDTCEAAARRIYGDPLPEPVGRRLERELSSIIDNRYAVMYVSAMKLVKKSMDDGYPVGSRGSVGSSLAATMAGITEVNPLPPHYVCPNPDCKRVEWGDTAAYDCGADMPERDCPSCGTAYRRDGFNIPFETFLGFEGNKEPDIDLNFAGEYQSSAHKYVEEIFGSENVFRAGTISTIQEKTAFGFVKKYCEERDLPMNKWERERLATACSEVRRTTGQHPGGIIIIPDDREIFEFCPVQRPANAEESDVVTTHFDYHSIDENLLKLDILGHDAPSIIRKLRSLTGLDPLTLPLSDARVDSLFNGTDGLDIREKNYPFKHGSYGIPEFGTRFVRQMLDVARPSSFADLVRISGLSHGTDVWANNAHDLIRSGAATMKEVISTRDDIMNYLIAKGVAALDAFNIMEKIRRGRGVSEDEAEIMRRRDVPEWYIESCRRIKYMFPKAHAVAYVMMSYRIAYYKVYRPTAFYAVFFGLRAGDFNPEAALGGSRAILEALRSIEAKGKNATGKELQEAVTLEVLYEMYARGYRMLPPDISRSDSRDFLEEEGNLRIPLAALPGVSENEAEAVKTAYADAPFISVDDMRLRAKVKKTAVEALTTFGALAGLPESNQISMF